MKKFSALLVCLCILMSSVTALAENEVTVNFNGEKKEFDVEPFIENDRTLVPMRAIFEAVGAKVTWDAATQTVFVFDENKADVKFIALQIGQGTAFVSDEKKSLDVPARIVEDRTFVPLRFVMEELGCEVTWDSDTYTISINNKTAE